MQPTGIYPFGNAWRSLVFVAAETQMLDVLLQIFFSKVSDNFVISASLCESSALVRR